jgi:outer membrane protein OmpA-like peptidoglycan-associated protein
MKNVPFRVSRRVLPVVAILTLSGCSDLDVFGLFEDEPLPAQTASSQNLRERADAERSSGENTDTPSLTSVPSRPAPGSANVRDRVVEGLISDRDNARYTDEAIRLQGSTRAVDAPQAAAAPEPVVAPAPTTPAPPAPSTRIAAPTPRPAPPARITTPRIAAPQVAAASPAIPAPQSSTSNQSVVVDMSALYGGGYNPVSAQISREAQVATIQFGHSSSRLDARDQQLIGTVASVARQNGGNILVVGHASSRTIQLPKSTHEVANFQVSFARANAVAQALIQAGVAPERVTVEAVSDDQPIYSEAMPTGEAGNRRAEIFILR